MKMIDKIVQDALNMISCDRGLTVQSGQTYDTLYDS